MGHQEFSQYYNEFLPKIYRYFFFRVSGNRELAEDLTEDTFMKAFEYRDSYDPQKGAFGNWLFTIAKNTFYMYLRKRTRVETLELEENAAIEEFEIPEMLDKSQVFKAMKKLPKEKRELVEMKYLDGFSYKEIADMTGKDENAARVMTFRALRELQTYLSPL